MTAPEVLANEGKLRERLHDAMHDAHYAGRGDYGDEGEGYNHGDEVEAFMTHPDFVAWFTAELQKARAEVIDYWQLNWAARAEHVKAARNHFGLDIIPPNS